MRDHNEWQQHSVILPEPSLRVPIKSEEPMGQRSEILVRFPLTNAYNALTKLQKMRETHLIYMRNTTLQQTRLRSNIMNLNVSNSSEKIERRQRG